MLGVEMLRRTSQTSSAKPIENVLATRSSVRFPGVARFLCASLTPAIGGIGLGDAPPPPMRWEGGDEAMALLDTLAAISTIAEFALELIEFLQGKRRRHRRTRAEARKRGRAKARPRN